MRATSICLAILLALGAASCGGDDGEDKATVGTTWDAIVDSANKEGKVVVYSSQSEPTLDRIETAFEDKYPDIDFQYIRASSGETNTRLDQERTSGADGGDVAWTPELSWFEARDGEGDLVPLEDLEEAGKWKPLTGYWFEDYVTPTTQPLVLAWNTDVVKEPLETYEDLLRPDLKGKIGALDLVASAPMAVFSHQEDLYGDDFLKKLAAQDVQFYPSITPIAGALAAGEIGVAEFMVMSALADLKDAPIEVAFPKPVTLASPMIAGALGWSKRPNAALVLVDFLLSAEGQEAIHSAGDSISPLGTSVPGSLDAEVQIWDPKPFEGDAGKEYTAHWNEAFGR